MVASCFLIVVSGTRPSSHPRPPRLSFSLRSTGHLPRCCYNPKHLLLYHLEVFINGDAAKRKILLKWMIWGYPYFWKPPFGVDDNWVHLIYWFSSFEIDSSIPAHMQNPIPAILQNPIIWIISRYHIRSYRKIPSKESNVPFSWPSLFSALAWRRRSASWARCNRPPRKTIPEYRSRLAPLAGCSNWS